MMPEVGSEVSKGTGADSGGDIAGDDGVDLNAGDGNLAKSSARDRLIAAGLLPVAATGAYEQPNEHVQGILNDPVPGYHQTIELPPHKTPQEIAAEMGATIREGDPAPESDVPPVFEPVAEQPPPDDVATKEDLLAHAVAMEEYKRGETFSDKDIDWE